MIEATASFKRLKTEQQRILDFAVLTCHAIPNLKKTIKGINEKLDEYSLAKPDYYNLSTVERLSELSKHYKENLSKYILLSMFSFFESYFKAVVEELICFHGGDQTFILNLKKHHRTILNNKPATFVQNIRKLQEPIKKIKQQKYSKHITMLDNNHDYRRPSEFFALFGALRLNEIIHSSEFKSALIPDLLENAFHFDLSPKINKHSDLINKNMRETFDIVRDTRNRIGHGDCPNIGFEKTIDLTRFLREFSVSIDQHLVEHFFILERDK